MKSRQIVNNLIWRFLERTGAQLVTFVVTIILARLLSPDVYGKIALVSVFTAVLQVFVDSGFANALIQKKETDDVDFSTVFYFNIAICFALYFLLFAVAPLIAYFYDDDTLIPIIRVMSLILIISGLKNVQQSYVSRNMLFKRFFFATLGGTLCAAVVGVTLAYNGFGVWALVIQLLVNSAVDTLIMWITVKWRPKKMFSFKRLKELFDYGWKLLVSQLITVTYNNLRQLLIGKVYSNSDLAFYNQGDKVPNLIVNNINSSIDSVLFPALAAEQDSAERVKEMTRIAIKISSFVMMPLMMGLAVCAEPLVSIVLTDKWLPCVPYLRIFCCVYAFYPLHTVNLNAINAMGHSEIYLKLEIIKVAAGLVILLITLPFGMKALAVGYLISTIVCQFINSWPNKRLLKYTYLDQLLDIMPYILLSCGMGLLVYFIQFIGLDRGMTLIIQILFGGILYIAAAKILKLSSYQLTRKLILSYCKKGLNVKGEK